MSRKEDGSQEDLLAAEALAQLRQNRTTSLFEKVSFPLDTLKGRIQSWSGATTGGDSSKEPDVDSANDAAATPTSATPEASNSNSNSTDPSQAPEVGAPTRWQNMLMCATAMVIQPEAQKRLLNLLKILRLANENLRLKITALQESIDLQNQGVEPKMTPKAIQQDIVATIRKTMNVICSAASDSLPAIAQTAVRSCVLSVPAQWAQAMQNSEDDSSNESAVLSLAQESLNMLQNVSNIVDGTLSFAGSYVQKLGKRSRDDAYDNENDSDSESRQDADNELRVKLGIPEVPKERHVSPPAAKGVKTKAQQSIPSSAGSQ